MIRRFGEWEENITETQICKCSTSSSSFTTLNNNTIKNKSVEGESLQRRRAAVFHAEEADRSFLGPANPAVSAWVTALPWHRVLLRRLLETPRLYIIIIFSLWTLWMWESLCRIVCVCYLKISHKAPQTLEQQTNTAAATEPAQIPCWSHKEDCYLTPFTSKWCGGTLRYSTGGSL